MMNADDIYEALKRRHLLPEWVLVRELRIGTGYEYAGWDEVNKKYRRAKMQQRIDAYALNCYPSNGFLKISYEIKVTHSDFIAEKLDPDKRAAAMEVSDQFYFAAPRGVIAPMEVPEGCGLVVLEESGRMRTLKLAPTLDSTRLDWRFVASLLRTAMKMRKKDFARDRFE